MIRINESRWGWLVIRIRGFTVSISIVGIVAFVLCVAFWSIVFHVIAGR